MTRSSFRGRVLALVLLAALPALIVIGLAGMNQREVTLDRERTHLAELARATALQQQRIIERVEQLLTTVDLVLTRFAEGSPATCMSTLAAIARADTGYGAIGVTDRNGRVTCADVPPLVGRDMAGSQLFRRAVMGDAFVVGGDTGLGAVDQELPFARPMRTADGSFTGMVFATLPLHRLAGAAVDLGLPANARVDLFDADGRLLLRFPDPEGDAGTRPGREPLVTAARLADGLPTAEDTSDLVDLDGTTRTYAFARVRGAATDLMVALGRPTAEAVAEAQRMTDVALLGVLALAIGTVLVAWTVGSRLIVVPHAATVNEAMRDPLTGLHNRRYLDAGTVRLEHHRRLERQPRRWLAAILFDLDHFGAVNKRHGHAFGDQVLREFASVLRDRFRESDLVTRIGGEEFAVVLEVRELADAVRIADEVRQRFAARAVLLGGGRAGNLTVSAGVAGADAADAHVSALLAQADTRLRRAKTSGRDRVVGPRIGARHVTTDDDARGTRRIESPSVA